MPGGASAASLPGAPPPCTGVVLAGGRNTRFGGTPKGLAPLAGKRVLDHVAGALAAASDSLLLVANDPGADDWLPGVPRIRDAIADAGPLAGVQAALAHVNGPILVVAWDMPFVTAELLRAIRSAGESCGGDALLPVGPGGRPEPLCAWYSPAALPAAETLLARGERRMAALHDVLRTRLLDERTIASLGDAAHLFANVNTREELARAEEALRAR